MSADTASASKPAEKPLITLLNAPADETESGERPASQCCGGGSCSL
ncbi:MULTISPECIES: hypothetical protein [Microbacterium]|nr:MULTISPECIES: hypothetical protein [Microbacterium]MDQ1083775.1 hypothetical protein [Microbacterium sp. SORGH_AS_0344]MDQ1170947.1 hypothetical protein [Microbacterium proteolyticum]